MEELKKTKDMERYEKETGKQAIWHGNITESYKKWQKEKEVYGIGKKGIGILINKDIKKKWKKLAKDNHLTLTNFIINAVDFYVENKLKRDIENIYNKVSHDLKESLTAIQGYSHLIIENESKDLNPSILTKINEIYTHSLSLEKMINESFAAVDAVQKDYKILIVEDDVTTLAILNDYFQSKGYSSKGVISANQALNELSRVRPKIVLLDIILPDIDGFELCSKIKMDEQLKSIPVYYITAIQESEVLKNLERTRANGYFLKPFKFKQFEEIFSLL